MLVNGVLRLLLDKATGRLCGLHDVRSGRRYLPDGIPSTLFELETKDEKDPAVARLSSDDAKLTATMLDAQALGSDLKIQNSGLFGILRSDPELPYWVKRIEAGGDVYANVHHHLTNQSHAFGHGAKPDEWVKIETLFDMEPGRDQPHLYLYNWGNSTQPAWFDSVRVEDLGSTPPK